MPQFIGQAQIQYPGNADVSKNLGLLGDTIKKGLQERRQRKGLLEIGQSAQSGELLGAQKKAFEVGRPDIGIRLAEMDARSKDRAARMKIAQASANRPTANIQEYNFAKQQGYQGSFEDWAKAKAESGADYSKSAIYATGPDGTRQAYQLSDAGGAKRVEFPEGVTPTGRYSKVDLGTKIGVMDNSTGQVIGYEDKDVAGEARQKTQGAGEANIALDEPKAQARVASTLAKANKAIEMATGLTKHPGLESAVGPLQSRLMTVSDDTANFEAEVETLKTNIFVAAINEMRELSKTGGALGSVTENEIKKMENSMRALTLSQGDENMRKNLAKVAQDFRDSMGRVQAAYAVQYGNDGAPAAPAPPNSQAAPTTPPPPPGFEVSN